MRKISFIFTLPENRGLASVFLVLWGVFEGQVSTKKAACCGRLSFALGAVQAAMDGAYERAVRQYRGIKKAHLRFADVLCGLLLHLVLELVLLFFHELHQIFQ